MLLLTRKKNQRLLIGDDIVIVFRGIGSHGEHRIGIQAPEGVRIMREEIAWRYQDRVNEIKRENIENLSTDSVENSVQNGIDCDVEYSCATEQLKCKKPTVAYKPKIKKWESLKARLTTTQE